MCKLYLKASLDLTTMNPMEVAEGKRSRLINGQRDGFGLASEKGVWKTDKVNSKVAFSDPRIPATWAKQASNAVWGDPKAKSWFTFCHSRTSTNVEGLIGAHPFIGKRWVLAHNGIVSELEHKDGGDHPCDSARLHHWLENGGDMSKCRISWGGYGAVIAYDYKLDQIHIWRERAPLCWQITGNILECATMGFDLEGSPDSSGDVPDNSHTVISRGGKIESEHWPGFGIRNTTPAEYQRTNGGFHGREAGSRTFQSQRNGVNGHWKDGTWYPDTIGNTEVMVRNKESFPAWIKGGHGILTAEEAMEAAAAEEGAEAAADSGTTKAVNTLAQELGNDYTYGDQ